MFAFVVEYIQTKEVGKMSILIWVVEGRTNDGELRDYECYLFKWAAKKHFEKLIKEFPEMRWSYGGQRLSFF